MNIYASRSKLPLSAVRLEIETRAVVLRAGKYVTDAKRGIACRCCQARENGGGGEREQTRVREVAIGFRFLILLLFCD